MATALNPELKKPRECLEAILLKVLVLFKDLWPYWECVKVLLPFSRDRGEIIPFSPGPRMWELGFAPFRCLLKLEQSRELIPCPSAALPGCPCSSLP